MELFEALVVRKVDRNIFDYNVETLPFSFLPKNDVLVKINYSSINYKDLLSIMGNPGITRKFPHIPGIDAVGTVVSSECSQWHVGDRVLISGEDFGMNSHGGFSKYAYVPSDWLIALPPEISSIKSMFFGTAGITAGLAVKKIMQCIPIESKYPVAITGATGGVGMIAVMLLKRIGYKVVAVTRNLHSNHQFLKVCGPDELLLFSDAIDVKNMNLLPVKYSAVVDVLGGKALSSLARSVDKKGTVILAGMVESTAFDFNVQPFILREISFSGVNKDINKDSIPDILIWMSALFDEVDLQSFITLCKLNTLPHMITQYKLKGSIGRAIVEVGAYD